MRALGFLLALGALIAAGCGGGSTAEEAAPATETTTTAPSRDEGHRPKAPAIEGVSLDGTRISLADFRGRPVIVNVWSSW